MIEVLLPAGLISLVLLGIHSYFGLQIIRRGIIFADLAIGQAAALGAAAALFLFDGRFHYPVSLAFALVAGLLVFFAGRKTEYLEAVIGLLYAFGISAVFILLSKSPHGMEEFQRLMAYDILFTPMEAVWGTAAVYALIGMMLWYFSDRLDGSRRDLLFFLSFAVTVTSSVRIAGVLVVFAILLAPAFMVTHACGEGNGGFLKRHPLISAWIIGTILNFTAIGVSYVWDMPTGYALVGVNSLAAIVTAFICLPGNAGKRR